MTSALSRCHIRKPGPPRVDAQAITRAEKHVRHTHAPRSDVPHASILMAENPRTLGDDVDALLDLAREVVVPYPLLEGKFRLVPASVLRAFFLVEYIKHFPRQSAWQTHAGDPDSLRAYLERLLAEGVRNASWEVDGGADPLVAATVVIAANAAMADETWIARLGAALQQLDGDLNDAMREHLSHVLPSELPR